MMKVIFLLCVACTLCHTLKVDFTTSKILQLQGQNTVKKFLQSNQVRVIYFYKKDVKFLKFFIRELEKSAEFLELYGVQTGFCNCTEKINKDVTDCKKAGIENSVHTYRTGTLLLSLELETMFDVNSIMSNILQLVMLREVPILQTLKEVEKFLGTMRGKKDVIFGHMKAIGTFDHRVFMEVAYAYMNKLQFVICTDKKATKLFEQPPSKDVSTVWWVWTKTMSTSDSSYHNIRYRGELNLKALAKFVSTVTKPKMFNIPAEGVDHPYSSFEVPVVRFYYNTASEKDVYQKAHMLTKYYGGSVGVLLMNMDRDETRAVTSYQGKLPVFSFLHDAEAVEHFLPGALTTDNIGKFIEENMGAKPVYPSTEEPMEEVDDEPVIEEEESTYEDERPPFNYEDVETQDDKVAEMIEKTKKVKMPLDLVPALTDKTFPSTVRESDTAVILLYFPFDAISMGSLRMFGEAADMFSQQTMLKFARVNCYDWTDVCQKEKITIYPTLRVYKKGEKAWDYKGPHDTQAVFSTFKLLEMSCPVYEKNSDTLLNYLLWKGENTLAGVTNTTVVGLFRNRDKQEIEVFKQFAENSRERIMFVYTDIKDAAVIAKKFGATLPVVILSKYDDTIQPYATFDEKYTLQNLHEFVENNKLPKLTVLTPLMFPEVRRRFAELLILFTDDSDTSRQSEDIVREIVKAQQFNNVSFNMMQVPDDSSVGFRVLREYTSQPEVPHLSFVSFQKGEVFNFADGDIEKTSVTNWLSDIVKGSVEPSTKLKNEEWKPKNKGYEFLKIMDWEAEHRPKPSKDEKMRSDVPDDVPDDMRPKSRHDEDHELDEDDIVDGAHRMPAMEEADDSDTRRDLFALKDSRLYHQAPGRVHHHGDRKDRGSYSGDDGYSSDDEHVNKENVLAGQDKNVPKMKDKSHDPSEL
ncbi:thioredoxin domain-containing protein 16-like [Mercenaria mercenaria]|uniref:thioredoxin domain-containing protein 16-like n=1 Tax=Mercenaria mercenaria TaxID=6596 RepID=UPI00234EFE2C|nr:thioredoxin domain-containing protein 16-like [Mercenaria mercenaria]